MATSIKASVLKEIRNGSDHVSGQELCDKLGVSRTAVWKVIKQLQAEGYNAEGPISADAVFWQARQGKYDCVLSMYHDQGHIATKSVDFNRTISITCGMPVLRTSVDHGTAFDIAGTGKADDISMKEAILKAARYAPYFRKQ
jgi:4-hydroxythreonine-4-phosphate dehydrogenase